TVNAQFDSVNTTLTDLSSKFERLLAGLQKPRIPAPQLHGTIPRAGRVRPDDPHASAASVVAPAAAVDEVIDGYETEGE
ncbi:hypothetical protein, partial [Enterococcus faecalis]|uniref:hypothetical protein n=1 Tax=Enterococcus faecalis TaxID=1351 RepID=UPI003D6B97B2